MTRTPGVSVIIPTCDRDDLLKLAIRSIVNQTVQKNIELVVADNAGHSDIKRWLADTEWSGRLPITYVKATEIAGPSHPRNVAAQRARFRYLAFLDDDAQAAPDWVGVIQGFFDAHPSVAILAGKVEASRQEHRLEHSRQFLYDSRHSKYSSRETTTEIAAKFNSPLPEDYYLADYFTGCNSACRSEVFDALGGFDTGIIHGQDHDLAIRCWQASHEIAYVPAMRVLHEHGRSYRRFLNQSFMHGITTTDRVIRLEKTRNFREELSWQARQLSRDFSDLIGTFHYPTHKHMLSNRTIMLLAHLAHFAGATSWKLWNTFSRSPGELERRAK